MSVLVITGTDTGVGKTVVSAAIAAVAVSAGRRVAVVKPAQTGVGDGEPGDIDVIRVLVGDVTTWELRRYPDPLAPAVAARRSGIAAVTPPEVAEAVGELQKSHDLVLVEGAGGLLVRFDDEGGTLADVAWSLGASLVVVTAAGLGTLNATALTAEAATNRGLNVAGLIIGRWPAVPDLAACCNIHDLPDVAGAPLLGALIDGISSATRETFLEAAGRGLSPWFGGTFDAEVFAKTLAT